MSRCVRAGSHYKRHKYKAGICVKCKAVQSVQLKELAERRVKRRAARIAQRKASVNEVR